jgi:hypothetical protein
MVADPNLSMDARSLGLSRYQKKIVDVRGFVMKATRSEGLRLDCA